MTQDRPLFAKVNDDLKLYAAVQKKLQESELEPITEENTTHFAVQMRAVVSIRAELKLDALKIANNLPPTSRNYIKKILEVL